MSLSELPTEILIEIFRRMDYVAPDDNPVEQYHTHSRGSQARYLRDLGRLRGVCTAFNSVIASKQHMRYILHDVVVNIAMLLGMCLNTDSLIDFFSGTLTHVHLDYMHLSLMFEGVKSVTCKYTISWDIIQRYRSLETLVTDNIRCPEGAPDSPPIRIIHLMCYHRNDTDINFAAIPTLQYVYIKCHDYDGFHDNDAFHNTRAKLGLPPANLVVFQAVHVIMRRHDIFTVPARIFLTATPIASLAQFWSPPARQLVVMNEHTAVANTNTRGGVPRNLYTQSDYILIRYLAQWWRQFGRARGQKINMRREVPALTYQ